MKLPITPMPYQYIHTHELPENAPHGWGTAFSHFTRKYNDLPGMLDEKEIPSNIKFWTDEVERCKIRVESAVKNGNSKAVDRAFNELTVAISRLNKESQ